jgi:predicted phage terminase large subunit-like protein
MFRYYRLDDIRRKLPSMSKYTTVDLAIGQTKRSDFTVVCTIAVDKDNNWFILDMDYGRYNVSETMNAIFAAVQKHRPRLVGMEGVAYQAAMKQFLERDMSARNSYFSIQMLDSDRKKELRIEGMHPRFEAGKIFFPADAQFLPELEKELMAFPRGQHDDLIDALAYQEQVAAPPLDWGGSLKELAGRIPIAGGM